ncbi:MAG TPA: CHAT domain-containing protein [Thermoanaerobaculia bacterium]|nr:CHAT domain-containing protein [Thermoanaerobaculia bacterium]
MSIRSAPFVRRGVPRLLACLLPVLLGLAGCAPRPQPRTNPEPPVLEREIHGDEAHTYPVELQTGQFLRVLVEEDGVNLVVRLLDPKGKLVVGADSPRTERTFVTEDLAALAKERGLHQLEVKAEGKGSGRYLLRIEEPRAPAEADIARAEAVRAIWNGRASDDILVKDRIQFLERARDLWRKAGDAEKVAEALFGLGLERYELPLHAGALEDFQQAAENWKGQSDHRSKLFLTESLTFVGRCLRQSGRPLEARTVHEQALALARELAEPGLQADNLNLLGVIDQGEGEILKAEDWLLQAVEMAQKAGDLATEARVLNNLGGIYEQVGELQKALEIYQRALKLAPGVPKRTEMICWNNLGLTYRLLGDFDKALEHYQRAAELSASLGSPPEASKILINLGDLYRQQGQLGESRTHLDRALALGRQPEFRDTQSVALAHLALLLLEMREPAQAVQYAREAVTLKGTLEAQTISRYALGSALQILGETVSARSELLKALELATKRGVRSEETEFKMILARMERDAGDLASANSQIHSAIKLFEARHGGVVDPELRASFLASKQDYYELHVDILMALHATKPADGFAAEALQTSERARARGLLDVLNEAGADIKRGADPVLIGKEKQAREEVSARDWHRREILTDENPNRERLAEAERKLEEALDRHQQAQVELLQSSPRYAELTRPQTLDVEEIQRQVLDGQALLLEYSLGAKRSFLWLVSPSSIESFELPGREAIEKAARGYYELLTVRNNRREAETVADWIKRIAQADRDSESAGRDLSRMILGPAEKLLGDRPLLIVADGALQYIPFAALPIPTTGAPLATRHVIVNLPSASVLAALRREKRDRSPASKTLAIFADPVFQKDDKRFSHLGSGGNRAPRNQEEARQTRDSLEENREKGLDLSKLRRLTFSQKEAAAIAALVPAGEVFKAVGFEASREAATSDRLEDYRDVHFATHGVLDTENPDLSGLVLSLYDSSGESQDGVLRLNDIYNLRLNADLVVLSACRTALGKEIRGEGLIGLTRGFIYAGAARVLATLWSVEDRATAELMTSFYRGMLREGLSPAAALRQAQLEMAGKLPPYFWAGFSLQGEWR